MEKDQELQPQQQSQDNTQQIDYEKRITELENKISQMSNLKAELFDMLVSNLNQVKKEEPTPQVENQPKKIMETF